MSDEPVPEKRMRLRYAGVCRVCGTALAAGTEAIYERATKTVRCVEHDPSDTSMSGSVPPSLSSVEPGTPGASARREYERRRARREARVRERFPRSGGLLLALAGEQQSTTAWRTGAKGEEALGKGLNALASEGIRLLHDRRVPASRANIDHLAVTTFGVYVIDAKHYQGRPDLRFEGGLGRPRTSRLVVGRRDCTNLVEGMLRQMDVVRSLVPDGVPVQGVLCFVGAEWGFLSKGFGTGGVAVLPPRQLFKALTVSGDLSTGEVGSLHLELGRRLRPA